MAAGSHGMALAPFMAASLVGAILWAGVIPLVRYVLSLFGW
jgi:membrane protein DedA with SNARE-associated domain